MKAFLKYILFIGVVTVWSTLCFIVPDFLDNPATGWQGVCTIGCYVAALGCGMFLLLYACSAYRVVTCIFYPVFAIVGAAVSFYRVAFHVTITPLILDVFLHTNWEEAIGVISWKLIAWVVFNLLCAAGFVWYRWRKIQLPHSWAHLLVAGALLCLFVNCNGRLKRSIQQRYPAVVLHACCQYCHSRSTHSELRLMPSFTPHDVPEQLDIIFVIGESVRSDHMQLNGYNRPTNPLLSQRDNIVSFPHIYTPYTHTLASVPDILTRSDSAHYERCQTETSFVPIMRQCGYHSTWISNQDLGDTFAYFPNECDTTVFVNIGKTDYVFHPWLDEDMLPVLRQQVEDEKAHNIYILHTIGSHWYYNNHVSTSFYHFQPITNNRLVTDNSPEQIINSYDNSILYCDWVLDSVIDIFQDKCALLIYLSDHSESLGEEGRWLHASDAPEQQHPACVIWYSDMYEQMYPEKVRAIKANRTNNYGTDFLFYSILSVSGIEVDGYSPEKDITHE